MLKDLKQFVHSKTCLSCDGCCNFQDPNSSWRPRITEQEKQQTAARQDMQKIFLEGVVDEEGFIATIPDGQRHICHFYNPSNHACGIYHGRPLECQLYPFLLVRDESEICLGVHLSCPYVQDHLGDQDYEQHILYLKEFFSQEHVVEVLRADPQSVGSYEGDKEEVAVLFSLDIEWGGVAGVEDGIA